MQWVVSLCKVDIYHIYSVGENCNVKVVVTSGHSAGWPTRPITDHYLILIMTYIAPHPPPQPPKSADGQFFVELSLQIFARKETHQLFCFCQVCINVILDRRRLLAVTSCHYIIYTRKKRKKQTTTKCSPSVRACVRVCVCVCVCMCVSKCVCVFCLCYVTVPCNALCVLER